MRQGQADRPGWDRQTDPDGTDRPGWNRQTDPDGTGRQTWIGQTWIGQAQNKHPGRQRLAERQLSVTEVTKAV